MYARLLGISVISNKPDAGSLFVRALRVHSLPAVSVMEYGPIQSTQRVCHGLSVLSGIGRRPYL